MVLGIFIIWILKIGNDVYKNYDFTLYETSDELTIKDFNHASRSSFFKMLSFIFLIALSFFISEYVFYFFLFPFELEFSRRLYFALVSFMFMASFGPIHFMHMEKKLGEKKYFDFLKGDFFYQGSIIHIYNLLYCCQFYFVSFFFFSALGLEGKGSNFVVRTVFLTTPLLPCYLIFRRRKIVVTNDFEIGGGSE